MIALRAWLDALPKPDEHDGLDPGPWVGALDRHGAPSDVLALAYGLAVQPPGLSIGRWQVGISAAGVASDALRDWSEESDSDAFDDVVGNCRMACSERDGDLVLVWRADGGEAEVVHLDLSVGCADVIDTLEGFFASVVDGVDPVSGQSLRRISGPPVSRPAASLKRRQRARSEQAWPWRRRRMPRP